MTKSNGATRKKFASTLQWRVARAGVRFTVKQGRQTARDEDGQVRTFRTRDAAERVARQLNVRRSSSGSGCHTA